MKGSSLLGQDFGTTWHVPMQPFINFMDETLDLGTPPSAILPPSDSEVQILKRKRGEDKSCSFDQLPALRLGRYSHVTISPEQKVTASDQVIKILIC
jgi:hypothetical protein